MYQLTIKPYSLINKAIWNEFCSESNQDTFLFYRDFMDYHNDRFQDFSLMVYNKDRLIALLPANRKDDAIYSHQGLSYGGLIYKSNLKSSDFLEIFQVILKFLHEHKITHLHIKELPSIYLKNSTNNPFKYIYFKTDAKLIRMDMHSVVNTNFKSYSSSRKEGVKRAQKHQLMVKESDTFDSFWHTILIPNLQSKHGVQPVHSLEEIKLLKDRFPNNIRQFNVYHEDQIVAGTTIFEANRVAHCQYISGNADKNELGSLDILHAYLLNEVFTDKLYFSFGTSNIEAGQKINEGLQFWKEGFGARSITQGFYEIKTKNYKLLEDIRL